MATALDRRLERLVTRNYSRTLAGFFGRPELDGYDDPDDLCQAVTEGWAADGLGGYTVGELDGFLKKVLKQVKRTVITAPLKAIKATVETVKTGSLAPMKAAIKEEVKAVKDDLKTSAPVAAVVANVVPGIGQVAAVGIAAAGAALKAKDEADKQQAAQKAAEAANAQAIADAQAQQAASIAAQAASEAAKQKALSDANAAQVAAEKAQADALEAQKQAALTAQANAAFAQAANNRLFTQNMTPNDMANAVATQQLQNQGYNFSSPEAQSVLADTVEAYQPVVGGSVDIKKLWPLLAVAGGILLIMKARKRGRKS